MSNFPNCGRSWLGNGWRWPVNPVCERLPDRVFGRPGRPSRTGGVLEPAMRGLTAGVDARHLADRSGGGPRRGAGALWARPVSRVKGCEDRPVSRGGRLWTRPVSRAGVVWTGPVPRGGVAAQVGRVEGAALCGLGPCRRGGVAARAGCLAGVGRLVVIARARVLRARSVCPPGQRAARGHDPPAKIKVPLLGSSTRCRCRPRAGRPTLTTGPRVDQRPIRCITHGYSVSEGNHSPGGCKARHGSLSLAAES